MGNLIKDQRHFLRLFVQTNFTQRKALLDTITQPQLKALSEIAHNIILGKVTLTPLERSKLKQKRRFIHLLGNKQLGYKHKQKLVCNKQKILTLLIKIAITYLEAILQ